MNTVTFGDTSAPELDARFPKTSIVTDVAVFDEIGDPSPGIVAANALNLESIARVTPEIAAKYDWPFDAIDFTIADFSSPNDPGLGFAEAVSKMGILNLERLDGVSPEIDAKYPEK